MRRNPPKPDAHLCTPLDGGSLAKAGRDPLHRLADRIKADSRITVLTGAGVSAASGIPTFRGPDGLWKNFRPEELATPEAFERDPRLVWEWYDWRRQFIARCKPNRAHEVLALWSQRYPKFTLITQNVDGLHERADTANVVRFHGSIWEVLCWNGCAASPKRWRDETVPFPKIPPHCPHCGGLIRPGVVWFGEGIDPVVLSCSQDALDCDIFLSIGTSSIVQPAASLIHGADANGAFTVEINVETTAAASYLDLSIQSPAEKTLEEVENLLGGLGKKNR